MAIVKFHKDFLKNELCLPFDGDVISDEITDTGRWSEYHDLIFAHEGKVYGTSYSVGSTEIQDESPWQYEEEVECTEMKLVEKTVKVWEAV